MNSFGKLFRISIYGESHGESVGIVIDGCPAGIPLNSSDFEDDFARRKSGAKGTTPRQEPDVPRIMSGVFNDRTTGAPIMVQFDNTNIRSRDYSLLKDIPRPGHADFTGQQKYGGYQDYRGGGHFSGRLTLGLVAAGVVARKIISPVMVETSILEVGGSSDIESALDRAIANQDSIGGIIECRI
ncbi:MAG: chorismate synthase, partial [Bacteroidales bacterium]|nr:chorismate synthase [Bacteroidales bacterium]